MQPEDPGKDLEDFLSSLPSWQRKYLEHERMTDTEQLEYASAAGTPEQMFAQEAVQREYERLLQRIPNRWQHYKRRSKRLAALYIPKGKPGRRPDYETLELLLRLQAEGKSLQEIAIAQGVPRAQVSWAIDRYRKLLASASKRSKRGTNPS